MISCGFIKQCWYNLSLIPFPFLWISLPLPLLELSNSLLQNSATFRLCCFPLHITCVLLYPFQNYSTTHNTYTHACILVPLFFSRFFLLTPNCRLTSEELDLWSTDKKRGNLISGLGYLTKYNLSLVHPFTFNFFISFLIVAE